MGVLLCGISGVRVGWVEDGLDREHERNGLASRQRTCSGIAVQVLDPLPRQLVIVHQFEQLRVTQDVLLATVAGTDIQLVGRGRRYDQPLIPETRDCAVEAAWSIG